MRREDLRSLFGLLLASAAAFLLTAFLPGRSARGPSALLHAPVIEYTTVYPGQVAFTLSAGDGDKIRYTLDGSEPISASTLYSKPFLVDPEVYASRSITRSTSVQWRRPIGDFPVGVSLRARAFDGEGRPGPIAERTLVQLDDVLQTLSLTIADGAFFDPDTGIYVVGNAIFRTGEDFVKRYPRDQKWWKYPGNFHLRGAEAERSGRLECFAPDDGGPIRSSWSSDVRLRINGNNTRGFPQHALRVIFEQSLEEPLFGEDRGTGFKRVLLRTAGNDQDHAFFRDALQHRLCAGLPFETSACVQSVLFVNGAYWGIHNLRERLDEKEIARRHGSKAKDITIIEDRIALYDGLEEELTTFSRFLTMTEQWDASGRAFVDNLERRMDVDGFLTYMAAQIVLANTDWPEQNVKWWRFTGQPDTVFGPRDGRWRFIMGDSDMGMGLATAPEYDMFTHIDRHPHAPMARLFKACLRSEELKGRFGDILDSLLLDPLSEGSMEREIVRMRDGIAAEMPTHIRRWRRPLTTDIWERHVEDLLTFARLRPAAVKAHAGAYLAQYPLP